MVDQPPPRDSDGCTRAPGRVGRRKSDPHRKADGSKALFDILSLSETLKPHFIIMDVLRLEQGPGGPHSKGSGGLRSEGPEGTQKKGAKISPAKYRDQLDFMLNIGGKKFPAFGRNTRPRGYPPGGGSDQISPPEGSPKISVRPKFLVDTLELKNTDI